MDEQGQVLRDVFGDSSSDTDEEQSEDNKSVVRSLRKGCEFVLTSSTNRSRSWERIEEIKGLWMCREFLCPRQQSALISSIEYEGWFAVKCHNQAMRFGDLPAWADDLANSVREALYVGDDESEMSDFVENHDNDSCIFPSQLLWREPFFDQIIVNVYQPGEVLFIVNSENEPAAAVKRVIRSFQGICAHVDLLRFEDGIAIVSLESACVMHFSRVDLASDAVKDGADVPPAEKIPVYLTPGSLVIMWGDARYHWKHEINRKPGFQVWGGQEIEQKKRTSVTLRKLRCTE